MTQTPVIKQQDLSKLYNKETYIDRHARMFESYAQRHRFLSGEDALILAQRPAEFTVNKKIQLLNRKP